MFHDGRTLFSATNKVLFFVGNPEVKNTRTSSTLSTGRWFCPYKRSHSSTLSFPKGRTLVGSPRSLLVLPP